MNRYAQFIYLVIKNIEETALKSCDPQIGGSIMDNELAIVHLGRQLLLEGKKCRRNPSRYGDTNQHTNRMHNQNETES